MFKKIHPFFTVAYCIFLCSATYAQNVNIQSPQTPQAQFAINAISKELSKKSMNVVFSDTKTSSVSDGFSIVFILKNDKKLLKIHGFKAPSTIETEGFSLQIQGKKIAVIGYDPAGLMYGGLELAEQISLFGIEAIKPVMENPYMAMRGTKFNIPLDVRTPSYSDFSDAGQKNIPEMWSMDFWKEYIDDLATYRYNFISLWNLHPFPSMVKVPDYPDIALNDVMRSAGSLKEDYPLEGMGFDAPEVMDTLEIVKTMTIDEKIDFWRAVMKYGKEHNVDFYIITWNIFDYGIENKYGITDEIHNETTRDYFKKSVEAMVLTYPDLKGIGLTTGENMHGATFEEKENWAFDTYAQGMVDALEKSPGRKMTFVHRQHYAGALEIADKFKPLIDHPDIEFIYSFKYAQAHVYSSTTQPFHTGFVKDIQTKGNLKTIWTLRNDDIYYFRWGAPDFVREFIKNIPYDVSRGYYYGSDQYIWGREFLDKYPTTPNQIELDKHWYHWMIWGRLGYNPNMENERFISMIHQAYPQVDATILFDAWQNTSMVYPLTTGFHWGALDFQWYIEGCQSRDMANRTPYRYNDINDFISLPPHPASGNISIPDFVDAVSADKSLDGITPYEVANKLKTNAENALKSIEKIDVHENSELMKVILDIQSMAYMGLFYSYKIRAATDLQFFRKRGNLVDQENAIRNLKISISYFKKYASNAMKININPMWTNRVGNVDWKKTMTWALHDLKIIGADLRLPSDPRLEGKLIFEGENAGMKQGVINKIISDYSEKGYLMEGSNINWSVEVPESGYYNLSFRYSIQHGDGKVVPMSINNQSVEPFYFWNTGDPSSWTVDEQIYYFDKGQNTIGIEMLSQINIDQLGLEKTVGFE